jgi:hypothetical protein
MGLQALFLMQREDVDLSITPRTVSCRYLSISSSMALRSVTRLG